MYINNSNASEMVHHEMAWKAHWIMFSFLFFIIGCFSSVLLVKAIQSAPELTRSYRLSVFAMVIILCFSRFVYLLLNPYEVQKALVDDTPVLIIRLLYALGQPSVTAGFGLIHASFLKVAKTRHYEHEPLLKTRTILLIVGLYFTFGVITEVVTVVFDGMRTMLTVSACVALIGCLIVTVTVAYSGLRILRKATENKRVLNLSGNSLSLTASREQLQKAKSIAKVAKVTLAASTCCFGITIANSVAFVKMFNSMSGVTHWSNDWQFITFVTCVRLLEIAMAVTLIYALSHTNMKLRKVLGLYRFTRRLQSADLRTMKSTDIGYADTWKSTSSYASTASSAASSKQFIE